MKLLIVIVNYKTADMTFQAIEAAMKELESIPDSRIAVVDNDSQDGSYEKLSERVAEAPWAERVEVMQTGHNGGFGYGNNFAIRKALAAEDPPEYIMLLNSDAFPDQGSIQPLIDYLENHAEAGITGSYIHGPDGDHHITAFRFPSVLSELEGEIRIGVIARQLKRWSVSLPLPNRTQEVDWLAGAAMMIRRQVLEEVGLFDETFFLYFEETDLCHRASERGWKTVYIRESSVTHIGSVSTGMKIQRRRPAYWFESRRYYFEKTHGRAYTHAADAAWVMAYATWRLRRRIQRTPDQDPPHLLLDFVRHNLRLALRRR